MKIFVKSTTCVDAGRMITNCDRHQNRQHITMSNYLHRRLANERQSLVSPLWPTMLRRLPYPERLSVAT